MSSPTDDLPWPELLRGADLPAGFESREQAIEMDRRRARGLRSTRQADAIELADMIEPPAPPRQYADPPATLASARRFLMVRRQFHAEVEAAFYYIPDNAQLSLVSIVPPRWVASVGQLHTFALEPKLHTFKMQLHRAGVLAVPGPLVAAVSGEVDMTLRFYQLHIHAIMTTRMAEVIGRELRSHQAYAPTAHVQRPIHITALDGRGRTGAITYLFKSYWPMRNRYVSAKTRELTRSRREQPLKPAVLAEVLQWLDRRRVGELIYEHGAGLSQSLRRM